MNTGLTGIIGEVLAIDPTTPAVVYVGDGEGRNGVFKSINSGGSWAQTGVPTQNIRALAINPTAPATLYAGTEGGGVFKSTDSGGAWTAVNTGLTTPNGNVESLAIHPTTPATLYAGAGDGAGVFKSTDSGGTWSATSTGLTDKNIDALAINPTTPATLYAGTSSEVFKSTDSGGTWFATGLTSGNVTTLAINPITPTTLYVGMDPGEVFKSTDSGGTWAAANTGLTSPNVRTLAINPTTPATLYAGTHGSGVFKSTDSGGTWAAVNTGLSNLSVFALAINPTTPATLYAGTYNPGVGSSGVFKSTDSGGTWAAVNTGLGSNLNIWALALGPTGATTLYAGLVNGGVWQFTPCTGPTPTSAVSGSATVCAGTSTPIQAVLTGTGPWNVTWSDGVVQTGVGASPATRSVSPSSTTTYTVTAVSDTVCSAQGGDLTGSALITVNTVPTPTASNSGPTCVGSTLMLSTPPVASATYSWTGPNSFSSLAQNPTIPSATTAATGTYNVTVTVGSCTSAAGSTSAVVNAPPATPTISAGGPTTFCIGGSVTLTSSSATGNQWSVNGSPIGGATANTYNATVSGSYTVTVTPGGCSGATSAAISVTVNATAAPIVTAPASVAKGSPNRIASVPSHVGSTYAWTITNGTITAGQGSAQITFTAGVTGTLTLSVVETPVSGCPSQSGSATVNVGDSWSGIQYYTATPCRILDTRNPNGPYGGPALASGQPRNFLAAGVCGIPNEARALSVNVTVVQPPEAGSLRVYRSDGPIPPNATTISFGVGVTRANNGMVELSKDGTGSFSILQSTSLPLNAIVDVTGWYE